MRQKRTLYLFIISSLLEEYPRYLKLSLDGPYVTILVLAFQSADEGSKVVPRIHWYIMTSPFTDEATKKYFEGHKFFGLEPEQVTFFQQGTIPCVSKDGRFIMEAPHRVAKSHDGNGGVYAALKFSRLLEDMAGRGIKYIDCYGVDNALVRVADPTFLGYFIDKGVSAAAKVVRKIHGGTLKASDDFPTGGYLLDFSGNDTYNYEFVTLRDLLLDSNFRGGGIQVVNSLRIGIDNCYITHFTTNGILVQGGHETYIRNSFLGQHITAGGDPGERNFSGTAINLQGNDNAVTDVVIFSSAVGIMVSGQANTFSGVHCYNKATGFGGTGIYLKLPGLTQTRIVHSYLDYTGIVAEDPVQLDITDTFFLGSAYVLLKSIKGQAKGVNIVDNMFSGSNNVDIVQLDQTNGPFQDIEQVVIDRNNAEGMNVKATVARGKSEGNGTSWTLDFNQILLFPDHIKFVQYTLSTSGSSFPKHVLRNVSDNKVFVESDVAVQGKVFVLVDQGNSLSSSS